MEMQKLINFFYNIIKEKKMLNSDENIKYNDKNISYLMSYIMDIADNQNIDYSSDENSSIAFDAYILLNDLYLKGFIIAGQGTYSELKVVNKEDVNMNKLIKIVDNKEELIQYIVVNKDAIKKYHITPEKLGVHTAHATTCMLMEEKDREIVRQWYNGAQKKVLLEAPEKDIKKIEYYGIEDIGYNQVPKGTLIAVSLKIMTRSEFRNTPIIKRFQTLNYNNLINN